MTMQICTPSANKVGKEAPLPNENDANNAIENGWYGISSTANIPIQYGVMRVDKWYSGCIFQTGYEMGQATVVQRRYLDNLGWQPWEYLNPPMVLGVEYRTTERFNGHPVYSKLFNSGALPAVGSSKIITFAGDTDTGEVYRCISVIAVVGALSYSGGWGLTAPSAAAMEVSGGYNTVKIVSNIDFSPVSGTADIIVKYWKTTD